MARYRKIPPFTGTRDGICIYSMHGAYFMRTASSLTAARVMSDPAFKETRRYSQLLAAASKIGSKVYRGVKSNQRTASLYRYLTGNAMKLIKKGLSEEEIIRNLSQAFAKSAIRKSRQHRPIERYRENVSEATEARKKSDRVFTEFHSSLIRKIRMLAKIQNSNHRRLWRLKKYLVERSTDGLLHLNLINSNYKTRPLFTIDVLTAENKFHAN